MADFAVHLRDRNPAMTEAWQREFSDIASVMVSCGDIFSTNSAASSNAAPIDIAADAVVSPANSFGFMQGGIDAVYTQVFGAGLSRRLQSRIVNDFDGELIVGQATIVETGNDSIPWCISAPTMRVPQRIENTVNAFLAFSAALQAVVEHNTSSDHPKITTVLCPGLGTAVGAMPADRCARQMRAAWNRVLGNGQPFPEHLTTASDYDDWLRS